MKSSSGAANLPHLEVDEEDDLAKSKQFKETLIRFMH